MRKILLAALAAVTLATLAGCPKGAAPNNRRDCVASGGHWQPGDSHHRPFCQPPAGH